MNTLGRFLISRDASSRRGWAFICLALFLALQLFASSTALHKLVHADADQAGHHCVITFLTRGLVSAAETAPAPALFFAMMIFRVPLLSATVFSSFDYRLSSSRAPPRV